MNKKRWISCIMAMLLIIGTMVNPILSFPVFAEEKTVSANTSEEEKSVESDTQIQETTNSQEKPTEENTEVDEPQEEMPEENTENNMIEPPNSPQDNPETPEEGLESGNTEEGLESGDTVEDGQNESTPEDEVSGQQDSAQVTDQLRIINKDEAFVIGWDAVLEAESVLEGTVSFQWQVSDDGENWQDIEGATEQTYRFTVSEEMFSKWYRVTAWSDQSDIVYVSEMMQPVKAVCYVESPAQERANTTVEAKGFAELKEAFAEYDDRVVPTGDVTVEIIIVADVTVDETIVVGCPAIATSRENTYVLKSGEGGPYTIAKGNNLTGSMILEDGEGGIIDGQSHVVLQNVRLQGYPLGEEPSGANSVSSIFELQKDNTSLTIQGNTELLNPNGNVISLSGDNQEYGASTVKIQSSTADGAEQGGCVGSVNIQGRISIPQAQQYIEVLGNTAAYTVDTDIAIESRKGHVADAVVVGYTAAKADPYELAYFRLYHPGDYWIGWEIDRAQTGSSKKLVILAGRPHSIFVQEDCIDGISDIYFTAPGEPNPKYLYYSSEYYYGAKMSATQTESFGIGTRKTGPVPTLAAAYARIRQLNNDEDSSMGANVVIEETQKVTGAVEISGTSYSQAAGSLEYKDQTNTARAVTFQWKQPAEIQRFILQKGEVNTKEEQMVSFMETLLDAQSGSQLVLKNVTISGKRGNESDKLKDVTIKTPLVTSHGGNIILDAATLKDNDNSRRYFFMGGAFGYGEKGKYFVPDTGCGGGIAVYGGDLTLKNGTSITNCSIYRPEPALPGELYPPASGPTDIYGGGIFFTGNGTLAIENSNITGNRLSAQEYARGAGICVSGINPKAPDAEPTRPTIILKSGAVVNGNQMNRYPYGDNDLKGGEHYYGAGIAVLNGAECRIESGAAVTENISEEENKTRGGGIYVENASLTINGAEVSKNKVGQNDGYNSGGGVHLADRAVATLTDATVSSNLAAQGGGIYMTGNAELTIKGGILERNIAAGKLAVNASLGGGAVKLESGTTLSVSGSKIIKNQAKNGNGGGIFTTGGIVTLSETVIGSGTGGSTADEVIQAGGNVASSGGGIAIGANVDEQIKKVSVSNCTIQGNFASESGGGVSVSGSPLDEMSALELKGTTKIINNHAANGGGLGSQTTWDWRNGISAEEQENKVTRKSVLPIAMTGTEISGNSADKSGGGIYADSKIEIKGNDVTVSQNRASGDGGGIGLGITDPTYEVESAWSNLASETLEKRKMFSIDYQSAKVTLENAVITQNTAEGKGGGIHLIDPLKASDPKKTEYFYMYEQIFKIAETPFIGNPLTLKMKNCTLTGNTAKNLEVPSGGMYQGDAVRVELAGTFNVGEGQTIWQDKTTSKLMEPYCSDNGYPADGSEGVTPHTGAYLSVMEQLIVNRGTGQEAVNAIDVDFPNYIFKRVIAKYENKLPNPNEEEVAKYKADAEKLALASLKVDKEKKNILLLRDDRYVPFSFLKYGVAKDGNGEKTPLAGVVFELYRTDSDAPGDYVGADNDQGSWKLWKTITSDKKGIVDAGGLLPGTYMLVEKETGISYEKPEGQWKVTVSDNKEITIKAVAVNGKTPPEFGKSETETLEFSLANYELDATEFSFVKVDSETKKELEGVRFRLDYLICNEESHSHEEACWKAVLNTKNEKDFFVSDKAGIVNFGKLIDGTYKLTEVQTNSGYELPTAPLIFQFDSKTGKIVNQNSTDSSFELEENNETYSLKNVQKPGRDMVFQKTNESGKPLDGAVFLLMKHDPNDPEDLYHHLWDWHNLLGVGGYEDRVKWLEVSQVISGEERKEFVSGEDGVKGQVDLGVLENGEYLLIEKAAPTGYLTPRGQWEILVGKEYTTDGSEFEIIPIAECIDTGELDQYDFELKDGVYSLKNKSDGTIVEPLPETGGSGTSTLYGFGLILLAACIISFRLRKKEHFNS